MAVDKEYLAWVLEQLSGAGEITARRMFGAVGLYRGETFFAIIGDGALYFKVDDAERVHYEKRNMPRFRPYRDRPEVSMNYYEVPAEVLEDPEECAAWALRSIAAAAAQRGGSPRPRPSGSGDSSSRSDQESGSVKYRRTSRRRRR